MAPSSNVMTSEPMSRTHPDADLDALTSAALSAFASLNLDELRAPDAERRFLGEGEREYERREGDLDLLYDLDLDLDRERRPSSELVSDTNCCSRRR